MGQSSSLHWPVNTMITAITALCLVAVVAGEPEASPAPRYGYHGYGHLGYHGYGHHLGYQGYHYGKRSADAEPGYLGHYGYGHGYGYGYPHAYHGYHPIGKRSADAEPGYFGHYGYGHGYGYGHRGYHGLYAPYGYHG